MEFKLNKNRARGLFTKIIQSKEKSILHQNHNLLIFKSYFIYFLTSIPDARISPNQATRTEKNSGHSVSGSYGLGIQVTVGVWTFPSVVVMVSVRV